MSDRPEIMMPVTPAGAVEQMLLEELRRTREANDRLTAVVSSVEKTLAVMGSEHTHLADEVGKLAGRMGAMEARTDKLETWRDKQQGAHGLAGWFINSPMIGWLAAAAAIAWGFVSGKGHP